MGLDKKDKSFAIRVDELLTFLRDRYGLYIDRLPSGDGFGQTSIVSTYAKIFMSLRTK